MAHRCEAIVVVETITNSDLVGRLQRVDATFRSFGEDGVYSLACCSSVLTRRDVRTVVEANGEHELGAHHFYRVRLVGHRIPSVLSQFELNRLTGFPLGQR